MPLSDFRSDRPRLISYRVREIATIECVSCGSTLPGNRDSVRRVAELRQEEIIRIIKRNIVNGGRWREFQVITLMTNQDRTLFNNPVVYTWFDMTAWIQKMQDKAREILANLSTLPDDWESLRGYYGVVYFNPEFDAGEMSVHGINQYLEMDRYPGNLSNVRMFICGTCSGSCLSCGGPVNNVILDPEVRGWDVDPIDQCCGNSECQAGLTECENCSRRFLFSGPPRYYINPDGNSVERAFCDRCHRDWWYCEDHDVYEHRANREWYCGEDGFIGGWRSNPDFVFHSFSKLGSVRKMLYPDEDKVYLGMELECSPGHGSGSGGLHSGAALLKRAYGDRLWMKQDGSVSGGMEICTHPMTLEYFRSLDWSKFDELLERGWRAWDDNRCGIHVHVGRNAFDCDSHLWKFAEMVFSNPRNVQKFAGRGPGLYNIYNDMKQGVSKIIARGNDVSSRRWMDKTTESRFLPQHYHAVNLSNANTVEVRIFRSSLKIRRILADLEFVDASVEYTRGITAREVLKEKALTWGVFFEWLDGKEQYHELRSFFKEGGEEYVPIPPTVKKNGVVKPVKVPAAKKTRKVLVAN